MTETEKKAATLLAEYDALRAQLRETERLLNAAVREFATEQKFGWYDKDKFRLRQQMRAEMQGEAA